MGAPLGGKDQNVVRMEGCMCAGDGRSYVSCVCMCFQGFFVLEFHLQRGSDVTLGFALFLSFELRLE